MVNGQCFQEAVQQYADSRRSFTDRAIGLIYAELDSLLIALPLAAAPLIAPLLPAAATAAPVAATKFTSGDAAALARFGQEAADLQAQRGMTSFGATWSTLANLAPQSDELSEGLFVYRAGEQIRGAMTVSNATNALRIGQLEGFGDGAGTSLVQAAVRESIARGFGGRIILTASDQAKGFYEKLGFVLTDPGNNVYTLSTNAAQSLMQKR